MQLKRRQVIGGGLSAGIATSGASFVATGQPINGSGVDTIKKRLIFVMDRYQSLFRKQGATNTGREATWTLEFAISAGDVELLRSGELPVSDNGRCIPAPTGIPTAHGMLNITMMSSGGLRVAGACMVEPYTAQSIFIGITPDTVTTTASTSLGYDKSNSRPLEEIIVGLTCVASKNAPSGSAGAGGLGPISSA